MKHLTKLLDTNPCVSRFSIVDDYKYGKKVVPVYKAVLDDVITVKEGQLRINQYTVKFTPIFRKDFPEQSIWKMSDTSSESVGYYSELCSIFTSVFSKDSPGKSVWKMPNISSESVGYYPEFFSIFTPDNLTILNCQGHKCRKYEASPYLLGKWCESCYGGFKRDPCNMVKLFNKNMIFGEFPSQSIIEIEKEVIPIKCDTIKRILFNNRIDTTTRSLLNESLANIELEEKLKIRIYNHLIKYTLFSETMCDLENK